MFFLLPKRQISNKGFQMFIDCIVHDLLLAKLSAYVFHYNSLELINSFLSSRKFRTKKSSSCNLITIMVVAQGSFQGPFLYTYTCVIFFYAIVNLINYADNSKANMDLVLSKLEKDVFTFFTSFQNKYMKTNSRKSHLLTKSDNVLHINVGRINSVVASMKNYQVLIIITYLLILFYI